MSNNQELETYRGYVIRKETDDWRIKIGDLVNFDLIGNEVGEMTGNADSIEHAKEMIDDIIVAKEFKAESFQTKEAFQWLLEVLKWDKRTTDQFISDHPHIGRQLPSEKDSLNYKWTQWAKQKIENLK